MGDETAKRCSRCGELRQRDEFYSDPRASDGKRSHCKRCHGKSVAVWRAANPEKVREINASSRRGPEKVAGYNRKYKRAHHESIMAKQRRYRADCPAKDQARDAVRRAAARGLIRRGDACQRCGAARQRIEASHDDYAAPLQVEWLCVPCHRRKDSAALEAKP